MSIGRWLGVTPTMETKKIKNKKHVFKRHYTTCSKVDNYSKFNSEHDWRENLYDLNDLRNYKTNDSGLGLDFQTISY